MTIKKISYSNLFYKSNNTAKLSFALILILLIAYSKQSQNNNENINNAYDLNSLNEEISRLKSNSINSNSVLRQNNTTSEFSLDLPVNPSNSSDNSTLKLMIVNSDMVVKKMVKGEMLQVKTLNSKNGIETNKNVRVENLFTSEIKSNSTFVNNLFSGSGIITIEADVIINNNLNTDPINLSGNSFAVNGVKQWQLTHHDDFNSLEDHRFKEEINNKIVQEIGWSDSRVSKCGNSTNYFLGGHCHFSNTEVSKLFENLPIHKTLRVSALFHMIDSWDGEIAYMKIDDNIVWTKLGKSSNKGINICGGESNDPAFAIPIDSIISHNKTNAKVSFGSTLDKNPCVQSFGVDDVMIFVK